MATVYAYTDPGGTPTEYELDVLDQSTFVLQDLRKEANGYIAEYVIASGDPAYPTTVTVKASVDPVKAGSSRKSHYSIRMAFSMSTTVGNEEPTYEPCDIVIAWNVPGTTMRATQDLMDAIGKAFTLTHGALTDKRPDADHLSTLAFGLVEIYE